MTDQGDADATPQPRPGDRRGKDRRAGDRRRDERRTPPPVWRRPSAFVAYGVVGALVLGFLFRASGDERQDPQTIAAEVENAQAVREAPVATARGSFPATREALTLAQYERLLSEGDAVVGEIVRAELYCGSINPVTARISERARPPIVALVDSQGRVGATECRWSAEARSADFLLLVPSDLVEDFARSPEVELNFVRRRRIVANVEWLGRSEELSLRNAGILREIALPGS